MHRYLYIVTGILLAMALHAGAAQAAGSVSGTVMLDPALGGQAAADDVVFVFARAANGPRMPLAILRASVKDLPLEFTLDDSTAMSPQMKLSAFDEVIVVARISKSGGAMPHSGDLEGQSGPVKAGSRDVRILIDRVLP